MEAGRELDALVAEKVMGLAVRFEKGQPTAWQDDVAVCWTPNDYVLLNADGTVKQIMYLPGGSGAWRVQRYSTDLSAAWTVVEHLKQSRKMAFVLGSNGCSDQISVWFNDGIWALGMQQNACPDFDDREHLLGASTASSAPLAICLAALEAVAIKERGI